MEARLVVVKTLSLIVVTAFLFGLSDVQAKQRKEIRFYKINKDEITQRLRFTKKKSRKPGCHNLLLKSRLHRTVQFGYKMCRVYKKRDCTEESVMLFFRDKEPKPTSELTQGYGWYPVGEHKRGEKAKSWYCE